ncbi:MAG: hypothetical protein Q4D02_03095 [Clostridia bacterium]|nr:hypothetical protein [Clostridia bacterium]
MFKFVKRIMMLVLIVLLALAGFSYYTYRESMKEKEERFLKAEEEKALQENLLKEKISNAKRLVENVSNEIQIVALRESGKYTIYHDKTPENNQLVDWLINSEIEVNMEYEAIFTIDVADIMMEVTNEGNVSIEYSKDDISISAIDIQNIVPAETKSLFGENYSPSEIAALEEIAKEKILQDSMTDDNISSCIKNIEEYFENLATSFHIEKITVKCK